MESITQKKTLSSWRSWVRTGLIATVLAIVFFAVLASGARTYRSTLTILVIAKSQTAALQQAAIVQNIASLPHTLAFYDRLLASNPSIVDPTAGQTPAERKAAWDGFVKVDDLGKRGGTIITLSILAKTQNGSETLVQDAAHTLFSMASNYYNVKNDIDLRIIDGPVTGTQTSGWPGLLAVSILLGIAIAWLFEKAFGFGSVYISDSKQKVEKISGALRDLGKTFAVPNKIKPISTLENLYRSQDTQDTFDIPDTGDYSQPEKNIELPEEVTLDIPKWEYPNYPEMPARHASPASNASRSDAGRHIEAGEPTHHVSKSAAPANLPIADDNFYTTNLVAPENLPTAEEKPKVKTHEPTPEEIKERLNQLLKGEM